MKVDELQQLVKGFHAGLKVAHDAIFTPEFLGLLNLLNEAAFAFRARFVEYLEALQQRNITEQTYYRVLLELQWPPPLGLTYDEMSEIALIIEDPARRSEVETVRRIEQIVLSAHGKDILATFVERWREHQILDSSEKDILADAIEAHCEKKFSLVVPTMMARVEGLVAKGFGHTGKMGGYQLSEYLEQLFGGQAHACDAEILEFLKQSYFVGFEHGQAVQAELSRHAVLHGGDTEYATESNSLRSIILYDFVLSALTFLGEVHDATLTLHRINGCETSSRLPGSGCASFFPHVQAVIRYRLKNDFDIEVCRGCFDTVEDVTGGQA